MDEKPKSIKRSKVRYDGYLRDLHHLKDISKALDRIAEELAVLNESNDKTGYDTISIEEPY